MKNIIYLALTFFITSCVSTINIYDDFETKSQEVYLSHLKKVEYYNNGKTIEKGLEESVKFLQRITNVSSEIHEGIDYFLSPNKYNLEDWKTWYRLNKKSLYWNAKLKKVNVKEKKYLIKNSKKEYRNFLNIIKRQISSNIIDMDDLSYAIHFIMDISGIKDEMYNFMPDSELPSIETIQKWENWFSKNKHLLYWDKKTQKVKTKER